MERISLESNLREGAGKNLGRMRREGKIPAILYGKQSVPKLLSVGEKSLEKAVSTEAGFNAIFNLNIEGKPEGVVRIREYQVDPIRRNFLHVDFQTVDLKEKIEVEVPIRITGKAEGVKKGGVLETLRRTLHLKCLVMNIPEHIDIDVSPLEIGQSVHADEIKLPEGVEFPHGTNFTIVAVVPPTKEEEVAPPPVAEAVAEGAAPEGAAAGETPKAETQTSPPAKKEEAKK